MPTRNAILNALSDPKEKMSRRVRETFLASLGKLVPVEIVEPVPASVKFARKLSRLPLDKVIRRQRQCARRASTFGHRIRRIDNIYSPFRQLLETQHREQLIRLNQATAELQARQEKAEHGIGA